MTTDFATLDLWDVEPEPEAELCLEPETAPEPELVAIPQVALMQVLPADFPLPALIRFVPDARLRAAAEDAAMLALSLDVRGPEALVQADAALTVLRGRQKAIEEHFAAPAEIANNLHKSLTGARRDWLARGEEAIQSVSRRIYAEKRRLDDLAAEERRKVQAEADRVAREEAARQAKAAQKAQAPAAVVEALKQQAKTAQAPPVSTAATAAPKLDGLSTVKNWTCTIAGTPRDADQQPAMADLTPTQRAQVLNLLRAVLDGKAPIVCFEIAWPYLRKRAKADESTLAIPGIEAYDAGGVRAKGSRSK
jgi:hypothetical protein